MINYAAALDIAMKPTRRFVNSLIFNIRAQLFTLGKHTQFLMFTHIFANRAHVFLYNI